MTTGQWADPRPSVALVVPGLEEGGGVPAVGLFLHEVLERSGRYRPAIVSLATRSTDSSSVRLVDPRTWFRGPSVRSGTWREMPFRHVGCRYTELEFQRYRPRRVLTNLLDGFSIVQVVAGSPAWANAASECSRPVLLQVATLVSEERKSMLGAGASLWRRAMTKVTNRLDMKGLAGVAIAFVENVWMQKVATGVLGASRVVLAPPGIDTSLFRPADYRAGGPLLSVGRFDDPRKNVRMLIEAYARLRTAVPNAPRLILAGQSGPGEDDLERARELGVANAVEVRTGLTSEALAALYREASLFVLSSDEEGLGIVILEAMASGLPVVATRCGGPETSITEGENGLLTPLGDPAAMAEGLRELLADPHRRRRMGEQGRRTAEQRFSLEAAGQLFIDVYDQVLSSRGESARGAAIAAR